MKLNIKKHLPAILTGLGVVGSAAVGVSAGIAQHKVEEELKSKDLCSHIKADRTELVKVYTKNYLPTAIIFALTSGCIIGGQKMSQKQYKQLLGAYAGLGAGFAGYRGAVINEFGQDKDQELVENSIAIMDNEHYICWNKQTVPGKELMFYEPYSKIYFRAQERDVILAEYHLNRKFAMGGGTAYVDDLLYFLGIAPNSRTKDLGWTAEHGYYWIDIKHAFIGKRNGEDCYEIEYLFPAEENPEDYIGQAWEDEYQEESYAGE